jgi:hypothetical protein
MAEGDEWFHAGGASGGDEAGGEADRREESGDSQECDGVSSAHAIELLREDAREPERGERADQNSGANEAQAFAENHSDHIFGLGAESDANPEFVGAARDGVGNHGVDLGNSQKERGGR